MDKKEKNFATYKEFAKMLREVANIYSKLGDEPLLKEGYEYNAIRDAVQYVTNKHDFDYFIQPWKDFAAIAELELLGEDGKPVSRQHWKVIYADSEETDAANNIATNVFDLQESTFWHTNYSSSKPAFPRRRSV